MDAVFMCQDLCLVCRVDEDIEPGDVVNFGIKGCVGTDATVLFSLNGSDVPVVGSHEVLKRRRDTEIPVFEVKPCPWRAKHSF